jgi:hypothetical protein
MFSNPKSQFGKILEGLEMEKVGIFYGNLGNITDILGNITDILVYFMNI